MAKQGMRRPAFSDTHGTESNHIPHKSKNDAPPVMEIQGKAKCTGQKANPII